MEQKVHGEAKVVDKLSPNVVQHDAIRFLVVCRHSKSCAVHGAVLVLSGPRLRALHVKDVPALRQLKHGLAPIKPVTRLGPHRLEAHIADTVLQRLRLVVPRYVLDINFLLPLFSRQ